MILFTQFLFGSSLQLVNYQIFEIKGFSYFRFQSLLNLIFELFYSSSHSRILVPPCRKNIFLSSKFFSIQLYSHAHFICWGSYFFLCLLHHHFMGIQIDNLLHLLHTALLHHLTGGTLQTSLGMIYYGHQAWQRFRGWRKSYF